MSETVIVRALPPCDFNPKHGPAAYDFKTMVGPWANGCEDCWRTYWASSTLGTGRGQRLVAQEVET